MSTPPNPVRGRLRRRLLLSALLVVALLAAAPLYLGPILRTVVVGRIEEELLTRARLERVSFGWPAHLELGGLVLLDEEGAPLASVDRMEARIAPLALLRGRIEADVALEFPELHLATTAEGGWNWERAVREAPARKKASPPSEDEGPLPDVQLRFTLRDGQVVVHGTGGETTLGEVGLELAVDGLDRDTPFRLTLGVRGPGGPGGRLELEGAVALAPQGRLDPAQVRGRVHLGLEDLELGAFAPILGDALPVRDPAGTLSGGAELTLEAGLALAGSGDLELAGLELRGPREAAPARVERVSLHARGTQDGSGEGTQSLQLAADAFLSLEYAGRSSLQAAGASTLSGTLGLHADLARLVELARGFAPLQKGVALRGRLESSLELEAGLNDLRPTRGRMRAHAGLTGLAGNDAEGHALDLADLDGLELDLTTALDLAAGTLSVETLGLRTGPVRVSGRLAASGIGPEGERTAVQLATGELTLDADLGRLRGTLAQVIDLEGAALDGHLAAGVHLAENGSALNAELAASGLALAGLRLDELRAEAHLRRSGNDLYGPMAGSATLNAGVLTLALADGAALTLPRSNASLKLNELGRGHGEHTLGFQTDDGKLRLGMNLITERKPDQPFGLRSAFRLDADVATLAALAAPFAPVQPGLGGDLRVSGDVTGTLQGLTPAHASGRLEVFLNGLRARGADGSELALESLGSTTLSLEGEIDPPQGRAELRALALKAGALDLRGSGRAEGLNGGPAGAWPRIEDGRLAFDCDLERLGRELGRVVDLGGWTLGGSPLSAELELSTEERRLLVHGRLGADALRLAPAAGKPIALAQLGVELDLGYDATAGSLHVKQADFSSTTARAALAGTLNDLATPEKTRGAMQLTLETQLERLLGDLGLEDASSGRHTAGRLEAHLKLTGDGGSFRADGDAGVKDFRLELASSTPGGAPLVIEEPTIALDWESSLRLPALDLELKRLTLASGLARGGAQGRIENLARLQGGAVRFAGLTGSLAYVPERLGAVLAPLLPGKLTGKEEERVTFTLDGNVRDLDLASLLAGSEGRMDLGIGRFERPEIQLGGALAMEAKDEKLLLRGDLAANGGTLQLDGALDLSHGETPPHSRLHVTAKELRANSGLAPLLAMVHPAFGQIGLAQGTLDGLIGLDLDLDYAGPLTLADLEAGWQKLPKEPIHGAGRLELRSASLQGSPLLALLGELGIDASKSLDLRPIEFTIQKGRVTYAKPWTWTLSGTETTFTGSLGLDQSLDLAWNVPITDALVQRFGFLSALKGQNLAIPVRGSVTAPRVETKTLLEDLAKDAAKKELEGRLGLGGGAKGDDPATLLAQADRLWSDGKKAEAAVLYKRLREDYKLSLTYALNKDRIKDRSKFGETPK